MLVLSGGSGVIAIMTVVVELVVVLAVVTLTLLLVIADSELVVEVYYVSAQSLVITVVVWQVSFNSDVIIYRLGW